MISLLETESMYVRPNYDWKENSEEKSKDFLLNRVWLTCSHREFKKLSWGSTFNWYIANTTLCWSRGREKKKPLLLQSIPWIKASKATLLQEFRHMEMIKKMIHNSSSTKSTKLKYWHQYITVDKNYKVGRFCKG